MQHRVMTACFAALLSLFCIAQQPSGTFSSHYNPGEPFRAVIHEDYAGAMKDVAAKFTGNSGVYIQLGDSNTYSSHNTAWARRGSGHPQEVKAFLKWSHQGKRNENDGWWLASVDVEPGRSHTAASGVRADEYLRGGKHGLPPLVQIIEKYNPQLALYMLGSNDLKYPRPLRDYVDDVERAVDLLLGNGTVVILSTLPPYRGKAAELADYNEALRELAARKSIPLLDLHAEMEARAGGYREELYLSDDGLHLSSWASGGPVNEHRLGKGGYLLRCYMAVHKAMEVKAKVFDAADEVHP